MLFRSFCDLYKENVGLPFAAQARAENVNMKILEKTKKAGIDSLHIALESANNETLQFLNRGNVTCEDVVNAVSYCKKLGIKTRVLNMIGLPVERPIEDAFETLEVNMKMNPTDSWVSIFQPMPKTELWRYCLKTGLLNPDINAQTFEDNTILNFEPEVANVINHLHKWWHYIVKYHFEKDFIDVLLEIQLSQSDK